MTIVDGEAHDVAIGPLEDGPAPDPHEGAIGPDPAPTGPPRPPRTRMFLGIGLAGAGALTLGVGVWAGLDGKARRDDARALGCSDDLGSCPAGPALDAANAAYGRANLSTGLLIAGVALAAGGVVLWLTAPDPPTSNEVLSWRVTPHVGDGEAGVHLSGSFW